MPITELLEELRLAFLDRGRNVDRHLRPGLSRAELIERARPLGLTLPDDLVEMYEWRNGQDEEDAEMSKDSFVFRDNTFIDVDGALREHARLQEYYTPDEEVIPYGFELPEVFPFAVFMGSSYSVVCGEHQLDSPHPHPVVGIFHSVDLYFHSLETMLRTCIEWVSHPQWSPEDGGLQDEIELEIWRRHNPGVFPM